MIAFAPRTFGSSTITARRTGSSRSAACCRSPRRPTTSTRPAGAIPNACLLGRSATSFSRGTFVAIRFAPIEENFGVYGVRKVWRQVNREGIAVARCTVARLMKGMGLQGAVRGKKVRTTVPDPAVPCPLDKVNRQFQAPHPNALWVSDFTYVATWGGIVYVATWGGFVCVAFVVDTFARRIVGWRASRTAHASFVLDALEQALHERRPAKGNGLVHHSDRGSQYLSIRYTERLAEAGIEPSVGSVGDSYDRPEGGRSPRA